MLNQAVTSERDDEQPQQQQHQESFDSTKRFHVIFTSFKLLVITYFNSQHTSTLSPVALQFYIICEVIYFIALIKVTGPACPSLIYRCLYIVFGTLGSELLLWTSMSLVKWLVVNMCLLVFGLALSRLLMQGFDNFREIVQLFEDLLSSQI